MPTLLEIKLEKIERLARGSILGRLLNNPLRYVSAIGFWRLWYPLTKRGRFARASTFFGGEMDVVLPAATEIYLFGAKTHDSEIRLARFLMKNLGPGDTFCDVGAHFGYFSLLASQLVGKNGQVLAFEASRSTYGILEKNVAPFPNIKALHRAASDVDKTLVFNEFPALYSEYNSLILPETKHAAWMKHNPAQAIEVAGVRLDGFFVEGKISPNIIKIDVEGAEPQVLRGMYPFLQANSPTLVMEYLISEGQNEAHQEAVQCLQAIGYQVFRIKKEGGIGPCLDVEAAMKAAQLDSDNLVFRKP
jgi:FkbM family methyltransferase